MSSTGRKMRERFIEQGVDQITGEARSVAAIYGVPSAAARMTAAIHNPVARGERASVSIDIERHSDQSQLHRWIRSYKDVREVFEDEHVARAHEFSKASPAMGIVAARQVLEIPYRGKLNMMFMTGSGVWLRDVVEAFGKKYEHGQAAMRKSHDLHRSVFQASGKTQEEMQAIIEKSRRSIGGSAIRAWQDAVSGYEEMGDKHAAGMSHVELGKALLDEDLQESLHHFSDGIGLMVDRLDELPSYHDIPDVIESDEIHHHLTYAVKSVATFDTDQERGAVDIDTVKRAAYQLDDYGAGRNHVLGTYEYLGRVFPSWQGRRFFRREAKEVKIGMETRDFLDDNRDIVIIGRPRFRKNHRNRRP